MSHGQIQTHKIHHGLDLGEATNFPFIVYFVRLHEAHIQMAFLSRDSQVGVPKLLKLGLPWLWGPITLCADLRLRWGLKQSCSPCWKISNSMLHATCMQGNWGDSRLLMVGSQTTNLTPSVSFGHNLCFRCPNGQFEPILDIQISIAFQWYKELLKPLGFDPCNHSLNIRKSTETLTPKVGVHLGVWGFFPHILFHSRGTRMRLPSLDLARTLASPFALVASPRLGLWQVGWTYFTFKVP